MKALEKLNNFDSLISFLILECLAITSFALGGINIIFYIIGIILGIVCVVLVRNKFSNNEGASLLVFLFLMFFISLLGTLGNLAKARYGNENIVTLLAVNAFLFMGIASRRFKAFKADTLLLTIGLSLSLLVFISMIYSWTQYGIFYAYIYRDTPIYYYNAELFNITNEGYWLTGFKFVETTTTYTSLFGVILSSYLSGLLFTSFKKDKTKFFLYLVIGLLGLVYLISIPNFTALLFLIPVAVIAFFYRFLGKNVKAQKVVRYLFIGLTALLVILFIIMLINVKGNNGLSSFIANNRILNRLFNSNRFVSKPNVVLSALLQGGNFLGLVGASENAKAIFVDTKMFEFEIAKEGGICIIFLLVAFLVFIFFSFGKYLKTSKDNDSEKIVLLSLLFGFFIYETLNYDPFPLTHNADFYNSFFRNPLTLVVLFLIGYTYVPLFIKEGETYGKEETKKEKVKKNQFIDEDYEFDEEEEAK